MSFTKEVVAGSEILTANMWNKQIDDIGSYFNYSIGVNVGSTVFVYSGADLISGNGTYENQIYTSKYIYDASGNLASGIMVINGQTVTSKYIYSGTDIIRIDKVIV